MRSRPKIMKIIENQANITDNELPEANRITFLFGHGLDLVCLGSFFVYLQSVCFSAFFVHRSVFGFGGILAAHRRGFGLLPAKSTAVLGQRLSSGPGWLGSGAQTCGEGFAFGARRGSIYSRGPCWLHLRLLSGVWLSNIWLLPIK